MINIKKRELRPQTLGWNILPRPPHVETNVLNFGFFADTGKLFSSKGEIDIADHALDLETARKLFAVDAYWTDLLSKEELEKMSKNQKIEKLITKSLEI